MAGSRNVLCIGQSASGASVGYDTVSRAGSRLCDSTQTHTVTGGRYRLYFRLPTAGAGAGLLTGGGAGRLGGNVPIAPCMAQRSHYLVTGNITLAIRTLHAGGVTFLGASRRNRCGILCIFVVTQICGVISRTGRAVFQIQRNVLLAAVSGGLIVAETILPRCGIITQMGGIADNVRITCSIDRNGIDGRFISLIEFIGAGSAADILAAGTLNTQLRLYSGSNAMIVSTKNIDTIIVEAGYKNATLYVYSSVDGYVYEEIAQQDVTTTFANYTFDLPAGTRYVILAADGAQIRISEMTLVVSENVDVDETVAGDMTGDGSVNNDDVVLLLWHTLFPEEYPLTVNADLTGDGSVNNDDVVLLLWHTLFPEDYPL